MSGTVCRTALACLGRRYFRRYGGGLQPCLARRLGACRHRDAGALDVVMTAPWCRVRVVVLVSQP